MSDRSQSVDWAVSGLAQLFDTVVTVAGSSGDLSDSNREQFVETGAAAFASGMSLSAVIDSYLGGAGEVWEYVFADADHARTVELSRSLRRVSSQAISSLAEGFEEAQRLSTRVEESLRRTFLDDLFGPHPDPSRLADVAKQLDFPAFNELLVAVVGADRNFNDGGPTQLRVTRELRSRAPHRHLFVTAKDGRIVIIAIDTSPTDICALVAGSVNSVPDIEWHVGVGEAAITLEAVGKSYRQATEAMRIGRTFGLQSPTRYDRILPQRLFSADSEVTRSLSAAVIEPLTAKPKSELMTTLASFIELGGNMAEVARELNVGARTVGYRLDRIAALTGYSVRQPDERFILELAYRAMPVGLSHKSPGVR